MVLTELGYLLLFLSGLAVGLFCWLSYACVCGGDQDAKHSTKKERSETTPAGHSIRHVPG